jgi:hypothetical protein
MEAKTRIKNRKIKFENWSRMLGRGKKAKGTSRTFKLHSRTPRGDTADSFVWSGRALEANGCCGGYRGTSGQWLNVERYEECFNGMKKVGWDMRNEVNVGAELMFFSGMSCWSFATSTFSLNCGSTATSTGYWTCCSFATSTNNCLPKFQPTDLTPK